MNVAKSDILSPRPSHSHSLQAGSLHLQHLSAVLRLKKWVGLTANPKKCATHGITIFGLPLGSWTDAFPY